MTTPALTPRPGDQLASSACTTRVVVVRVPANRTPVIECGGSPMVAAAPGARPAPPGPGAATLIGKRYVDATETVELLCTSSGTGALSCDGVAMTIKAAKPLPASDLSRGSPRELRSGPVQITWALPLVSLRLTNLMCVQ
jgi:hypothetical protein